MDIREVFPHLVEVMTKYGEVFVEKYRQGLIDKDAIVTRNLFNEVHYTLVCGKDAFVLSLATPKYAEYLENGTGTYAGRQPYWPPKGPIAEWIRVKQIVPYPYNGKLPTVEQLEYLIRRSFAGLSKKHPGEGGIKPRKIYQTTLDTTKDEWMRLIKEAITEDVNENIVDIIKVLYNVAN